MNISIKGTNFEIDEKTRGLIEKKAEKVVEKFSKKSGVQWNVQIELERSKKQNKGNIFRAEIQIDFPGSGKGIRAEGKGDSWRQAIDKVDQRIRRVLRDFKEKKTKK